MQDLQEAIQDAQWLGVAYDPIVRPSKKIRYPTNTQVENLLKVVGDDHFRMVNTLADPLGEYMFGKYLHETKEYFLLSFLMEIDLFQSTYNQRNRILKMGDIWHTFLGPESSLERAEEKDFFSNFRKNHNPEMLSIEDKKLLDRVIKQRLERPPLSGIDTEHSEIQVRYNVTDSNVIGIIGEILQPILHLMEKYKDIVGDANKAKDETRTERTEHGDEELGLTSVTDPPMDIFNDVRDVVVGRLATSFRKFLKTDHFTSYLKMKLYCSATVREVDFSLFRVLGRGGFGSVNGCKKRDTGKTYAMKVMNKRHIKSKKSIEMCLNEKNMLQQMSCPFVISLKYAFQTSSDLMLVLDIFTGGDLQFHLAREGTFTESRALFYAACMVLGIQHIHQHDMVYRDLKPENVLLDEEGYAAISDMGLAESMRGKSRLRGICGTRGYWAPEMLWRDRSSGYGKDVDWWSFGCVVYEMIVGVCPFRSKLAQKLCNDRHESMARATVSMEVEFPREISSSAQSLIQALLVRDPDRRLGHNGAQEVMEHPWFATMDWGQLRQRRVQPPFAPKKDVNAASQDVIGGFKNSSMVSFF
eukprot:TRINITY_DN370_c0_g1_i1.p1 TRINITY_DN370_c0_g1~~TRINITY_DN370_c0_g1_i1.p1  ORF type:complete len:584 (-),score=103.85 TRINITY_DN370_c0_g1_i1:540-2291(-)